MLDKNEVERLNKEKEMQDYIRRERLNELMLIHPDHRKESEESELSELLVDFPCFSAVAEDNFEDLIKLTKEIYMECLLPDTAILHQDEEPENCYVLTQGQCKVSVTFKTIKFNKVKETKKQMCVIGNRTCFGELSLLFNSKRTATVESLESCNVIIIPKKTFNKYMKKPMIKQLSITLKFLKSLIYFDELDPSVLVILASKTQLSFFQQNTLISRQDKKSKYLYFISKGRVKIVRNVPMLKINQKIDESNYTKLYQDPTAEELKDKTKVSHTLLELAELGQYESFGEEYSSLSNFMLTPQELSMSEVSYTAISCLPAECYKIRKKDFYEYIDDKTKKQFLMSMRQYPSDFDLRAAYYEQYAWKQYKTGFLDMNIKIPMQIATDKLMMQEIELADAQNEKKRSTIILPKINKKAQQTQRIMSFQKVKKFDSAQIRLTGIKKDESQDQNQEAFTSLQEFTMLANSCLTEQEKIRLLPKTALNETQEKIKQLISMHFQKIQLKDIEKRKKLEKQLPPRESMTNLPQDRMVRGLLKIEKRKEEQKFKSENRSRSTLKPIASHRDLNKIPNFNEIESSLKIAQKNYMSSLQLRNKSKEKGFSDRVITQRNLVAQKYNTIALRDNQRIDQEINKHKNISKFYKGLVQVDNDPLTERLLNYSQFKARKTNQSQLQLIPNESNSLSKAPSVANLEPPKKVPLQVKFGLTKSQSSSNTNRIEQLPKLKHFTSDRSQGELKSKSPLDKFNMSYKISIIENQRKQETMDIAPKSLSNIYQHHEPEIQSQSFSNLLQKNYRVVSRQTIPTKQKIQ